MRRLSEKVEELSNLISNISYHNLSERNRKHGFAFNEESLYVIDDEHFALTMKRIVAGFLILLGLGLLYFVFRGESSENLSLSVACPPALNDQIRKVAAEFEKDVGVSVDLRG